MQHLEMHEAVRGVEYVGGRLRGGTRGRHGQQQGGKFHPAMLPQNPPYCLTASTCTTSRTLSGATAGRP